MAGRDDRQPSCVGDFHGREGTAWSHWGSKERQALAAIVRAANGRAWTDGADGHPDADVLGFAGRGGGEEKFQYKPTRRGGGGALKVLWWQGPTLLNPHFATGTKEQDASRIFHEPLARWDPDGDLLPVLAAEIPSRENGGLAADGKSVTWKLKRGVSGTTASRSPPTMSSSTGSTHQIPRPRA